MGSLNKVTNNHTITFLFTVQECWVPVRCTVSQPRGQSWHVHRHHFKLIMQWMVDFFSFCLYPRLTVRFMMCFNFKYTEVPTTSTFHETDFMGLYGKCTLVNRLFSECIWVSVQMLNTHCADWQTVPTLLIQICLAEAVQKVPQFPDRKD